MSDLDPNTDTLSAFGYAEYLASMPHGDTEYGVGRITAEHKTLYRLMGPDGDREATVRGLFHEEGTYPKVGDWVEYSPVAEGKAMIERILPRKTVIARMEDDGVNSQVIAANVDIVCIVQGLDHDFNPRRLERYLLLAQQSKCVPFIILTKADIATDIDAKVERVVATAPEVLRAVVSAVTGAGMDVVERMLSRGKTAVLLGSSGAGKSTLTNYLLGSEQQKTAAVREDDGKGKHTTTHRELFLLQSGGILIDTPGMRELGLPQLAEPVYDEVFETVANLALTCRYPNCDHEKTQDCAILRAIKEGTIDSGQFRNYQRLLKEQAFKARAHNEDLLLEHKQDTKKRQKGCRKIQNQKYKDRGSR